MRPILPSAVRPIFERHDADGRGLLSAPRARDALLDLGCRLTLGEVSALVRRHGSFLPGVNREDATVNLAQFLSLVEHVRAAPVPPLAISPKPRTFLGASAFNGVLGGWNVAKVTQMRVRARRPLA